jgi:16S rRNA processing protein RimM
MIPYVDAFIKNKDVENKRIDVELIEGFINED